MWRWDAPGQERTPYKKRALSGTETTIILLPYSFIRLSIEHNKLIRPLQDTVNLAIVRYQLPSDARGILLPANFYYTILNSGDIAHA